MDSTTGVNRNQTWYDFTKPAQPAAKTSAEDPMASKTTFMQLLVAQIKNQNPLNPSDGVEFLSQLTQFTNLEQTMAMRQELETIREAIVNQNAEGEAAADNNN